jgi:hypothetical protein
MSLDSAGPLTTLASLLSGLVDDQEIPLIRSVTIGVPTAIGTDVGAYVALGAQSVKRVASGVIQREASYYVGICYQVQASISAPELAVGAIVDALIRAIYADLTLGGQVTQDVLLDLSLSREPRYQLVVGQEFRVYPVVLTLIQRDSYNVTP